jgi:IclR family acetate operon transcriptional repressor
MGDRVSRVQSLERAFAVLTALADGPLGVTEVAERVDLPKSTVARLLGALVAEGAVEQVPGGTRYRVGGRIATLAAAVQPTRSMLALARPELVELAATVGEASGFAIADGFRVHFVDQVDTPNPVQVRDWTGSRIPMHAVPSGQVILAHLPPAVLDRFLARPLERFTDRTVTDPAALRERLRRVERDGFAWVREEYAEGINSVAAPISDPLGEIVAAVHVHGPSYRFPADETDDEVARLVVAAGARISARIRGGAAGPLASRPPGPPASLAAGAEAPRRAGIAVLRQAVATD